MTKKKRKKKNKMNKIKNNNIYMTKIILFIFI